jgi:3',5'-cyclic-nucleotide phosphodiesterase
MASIRELESIRTDCTPTLVFVDVLTDPEGRNRSKAVTLPGNAAPLPPLSAADRTSKPDPTPLDPEHFYGISVLKHIATEIHVGNLSKLIVPIAMCRHPEQPVSLDVLANNHGATRRSEEHALASRGSERSLPVDARRMAYCLEKGAVDVVRNPIAVDRLETLLVHGYRAHIEGRRQQPAALEMYRRRKRSWVGVEEEKPYSYLRESMHVSSLLPFWRHPDRRV